MPVSLETLDTSKIPYSQLEILVVFKFGSLAPSEIYHKHLFDWFIVDVLAAYLSLGRAYPMLSLHSKLGQCQCKLVFCYACLMLILGVGSLSIVSSHKGGSY